MFQLEKFFNVEHDSLLLGIGLHRFNHINYCLLFLCARVFPAHFRITLNIDAGADCLSPPLIIERECLIGNVAEHRFVGVEFVVGKYMGDNGKSLHRDRPPIRELPEVP